MAPTITPLKVCFPSGFQTPWIICCHGERGMLSFSITGDLQSNADSKDAFKAQLLDGRTAHLTKNALTRNGASNLCSKDKDIEFLRNKRLNKKQAILLVSQSMNAFKLETYAQEVYLEEIIETDDTWQCRVVRKNGSASGHDPSTSVEGSDGHPFLVDANRLSLRVPTLMPEEIIISEDCRQWGETVPTSEQSGIRCLLSNQPLPATAVQLGDRFLLAWLDLAKTSAAKGLIHTFRTQEGEELQLAFDSKDHKAMIRLKRFCSSWKESHKLQARMPCDVVVARMCDATTSGWRTDLEPMIAEEARFSGKGDEIEVRVKSISELQQDEWVAIHCVAFRPCVDLRVIGVNLQNPVVCKPSQSFTKCSEEFCGENSTCSYIIALDDQQLALGFLDNESEGCWQLQSGRKLCIPRTASSARICQPLEVNSLNIKLASLPTQGAGLRQDASSHSGWSETAYACTITEFRQNGNSESNLEVKVMWKDREEFEWIPAAAVALKLPVSTPSEWRAVTKIQNIVCPANISDSIWKESHQEMTVPCSVFPWFDTLRLGLCVTSESGDRTVALPRGESGILYSGAKVYSFCRDFKDVNHMCRFLPQPTNTLGLKSAVGNAEDKSNGQLWISELFPATILDRRTVDPEEEEVLVQFSTSGAESPRWVSAAAMICNISSKEVMEWSAMQLSCNQATGGTPMPQRAVSSDAEMFPNQVGTLAFAVMVDSVARLATAERQTQHCLMFRLQSGELLEQSPQGKKAVSPFCSSSKLCLKLSKQIPCHRVALRPDASSVSGWSDVAYPITVKQIKDQDCTQNSPMVLVQWEDSNADQWIPVVVVSSRDIEDANDHIKIHGRPADFDTSGFQGTTECKRKLSRLQFLVGADRLQRAETAPDEADVLSSSLMLQDNLNLKRPASESVGMLPPFVSMF